MFETIAFATIAKVILVVIIGGFMPASAITFLTVAKRKKHEEFTKALNEMDISSSRTVESTFGAGRFFLPVTFATLICLLAITYFTFASSFAGEMTDSLFLTNTFFGEGNQKLIYQSLSVLSMAFLGGFLWSAQTIIVRLVANDIAPSVYYSAGIRIILASAIALILSFVIGAESGDSGENVIGLKSSLGAISFLTGMFPERVLNYLINMFKRFVRPDKLNDETLSMYKIEGMSMQHRERLAEIGIENAQNLSTCSLTKLLLETPFGARQLLDWIGQAKLLCYTKENIDKLRSVGIRSVFDLVKVKQTPQRLNEISETIGLEGPLLQVIYDQIVADKGIQSLYKFQFGVDSPTRDHIAAQMAKDNSTIDPTVVSEDGSVG